MEQTTHYDKVFCKSVSATKEELEEEVGEVEESLNSLGKKANSCY